MSDSTIVAMVYTFIVTLIVSFFWVQILTKPKDKD